MQPLESFGDLRAQLESIGWTLQREDLQNGVNVAKGKGPGGQTMQGVGSSPEMALFMLLSQAERANKVRRFAALQAMGAWSANWVDDKQQIARAYAELPAYDQKAAESWIQLGNESIAQTMSIRNKIEIEETDDPNPYHSVDELIRDVHHNQHFTVSRADAHHPIWSEDQVIAFRIVNNVVAHAQAKAGWDWEGVNAATQIHMPIVSSPAREALFVETVGRKAYADQYPGHSQHKIGFLTDHLNQKAEGEHITVPKGGDVTMLSKVAMTPWNDYPAIDPDTPEDLNAHWESPYANTPTVVSGSPEDYINREAVVANSNKLRNPGREWWEQDPETQKLAILNAFKTSILSPLKHLKWNTAHYQALANASPSSTARELWDILDDVRESHNQALGAMPGEHIGGLKKLAKKLADLYKAEGQHPAEAWRYAKDMVYRETAKVEEELKQEYHDAGEEFTDLRLHLNARKIVESWVDSLLLSRGAEPEPHSTESSMKGSAWVDEEKGLERFSDLGYDPKTAPKAGGQKYGGFMGGHIEAIANIAPYLETLRQYAQKDIKEDGGRGFIWRAGVKHLGVKGVDDKVASFTWLLLMPHTSELSILDTHALRGLGLTEDATNRKNAYQATERAQKVMRDLSGYSDMPHGQFHWGMWDAIRTPGHVSDHSGFRVLDPEPWWELEWQDATNKKIEPIWHGAANLEAARIPAEIMRKQAHNELGSKAMDTIYQRIRNGEIIPQVTHHKDKQTKEPIPNPHYVTPEDLWTESPDHPGFYMDGTPINAVTSRVQDRTQATNDTSANPMASLIDMFVDMKPTSQEDAIRLGNAARNLNVSKRDFERFLKVQEEDAGTLPGWKNFKRTAIRSQSSILR